MRNGRGKVLLYPIATALRVMIRFNLKQHKALVSLTAQRKLPPPGKGRRELPNVRRGAGR